MKLLKDEIITIEEGPVKISMNPVTTSIQARLMELAIGELTIAKNVERTQYCLKHVIKGVEIDGKEYDPIVLAEQIDLGDKQSRDVFIQVGQMVMGAAFLDEETGKKSEQPPKHTSSGDDASNAHGQKKDKGRKKAA